MNAQPQPPLTRQEQELLARAHALQRAGNWGDAAALHRKLLKNHPGQPLLLNNVGMAALMLGQAAEAVNAFKLSLRQNAAQPNALNNLGVALQQLARQTEALACFEQALQLNPGFAQASFNRGNALLALRQPQAAIASFDQALACNPGYAKAYLNRGICLLEIGHPEAALADFDAALGLKADPVPTHRHRGDALRQLGRTEAALSSYMQAARLDPHDVLTLVRQGIALAELRRFAAAAVCFEQTVRLAPDVAEHHFNLGNAYRDLYRLPEALASYRQALALQPHNPQIHCNCAAVLRNLDQPQAALDAYDRAIALAPDSAELYSNRGLLHQEIQQLDSAQADYAQALALEPDCRQALWNTALLTLLRGEMREGWRLFEQRWRVEPLVRQVRNLRQPLWLGGTAISGQTLLIHPEQGLGDFIQFCRYVPLLAQSGARILLETPPALLAVAATLPGNFTLLRSGDAPPAFDYHCPIMSLPLACQDFLHAIPANVPYLFADGHKVAAWERLLGPRQRPRIGLVWQGGLRADQPHILGMNARRNIPLALFRLFKDAPVEFHSLQKGEPGETELAELQAAGWDGPPIRSHAERLHDFSDTAALIAQLDLVISVDTSTAHLAAAMGREVWLLNRFDTCWRWGLGSERSAWYPQMQLFRQPAANAWPAVLEQVKLRLAAKFALPADGEG